MTAGPWAGRSVLVLGGTATQAAGVRERVGDLGARVLVNLGARTTHVLCLPGADRDPRFAKVRERTLTILEVSDIDTAAPGSVATESVATGPTSTGPPTTGPDGEPALRAAVEMARGQVIDLPDDVLRLSLSASWLGPSTMAMHRQTFDVDVVALMLRADESVERDDDFVFYNQPSTPDGGARLTVDGDCEQGIHLDLPALGDDTVRVRIAAAIDGPVTFDSVGAVRLSLADGDAGTEIASATLDAATDERTLVLAEVYRRGDAWRFRVVGQGYEHGLGQFIVDHGVEIT